MERSSAFTINNYISKSTNETEMFDFDNEETSFQADPKVRFGGNPKVCPSRKRNDDVCDPTAKWNRRRRYPSMLLIISSLFSLVAFILVGAMFLGFVEPRNIKSSNGCHCVRSSPDQTTGKGALKKDMRLSRINEVEKDFKGKIARMDARLKSLDEKVNSVESLRMKFGRFQNFTYNNLTQVSLKLGKLALIVTQLTSNEKKAHEDITNLSANVSNLLSKLEKSNDDTRKRILEADIKSKARINQLKQETQINTTKVILKMKNISFDFLKFQNLQRKTERNLTFLSQTIDDLAANFKKLNSNQKKDREDITTLSANISNLFTSLEKTDNDTINRILDYEIESNARINQLKRETQINETKLIGRIRNMSFDFLKLVNDTSEQMLKATDITNLKFEHLQRTTERNLTLLFQSTDVLAINLQQLENNTKKKILNHTRYINQLLDPAKFRGPRGYNGTRGLTGQPGPAGPKGPRGSPMRIDFTNCQYKSENESTTDAVQRLKMSDTKNQIVLAFSCSSNLTGGIVLLNTPKEISTGFEHSCTCENHELYPVTIQCTMKYLLCTKT